MRNPEQLPESLVISLGRVMSSESKKADQKRITEIAALCKELDEAGIIIDFVCGGGMTARANIEYFKSRGVKDSKALDRVGIAATHTNTVILTHFLRKQGLKVNCLLSESSQDTEAKIFTTGGNEPGHTTDYIAVQQAIERGVKTIINLTDGPIWERDEKDEPDETKPIKTMTWHQYQDMFNIEYSSGMRTPWCPKATKAAQEANLTVVVLDGRDINNLRKYLAGEEFDGTIIRPDEEA